MALSSPSLKVSVGYQVDEIDEQVGAEHLMKVLPMVQNIGFIGTKITHVIGNYHII